MAQQHPNTTSIIDKMSAVHGESPFVVIFDCESDTEFKQVSGMDRCAKMTRMQCTIACAIVIASENCSKLSADNQHTLVHKYHFWRHESPGGKPPFDGLLWLFDRAEVIVAYNGLDFDFPLLRKHYTKKQRYMEHRLKCLDPFSRIRAATDQWFKLDALLRTNDLPTKSGHGLLAIALYEQGKYADLKAYCEDDVELLMHLVLRDRVIVPDIGVVPAHLTSLVVAIASSRYPLRAVVDMRAAADARAAADPEEEFVVV
tara:strand:- start:637 stop:1410 length:774 start_codon:yes stop_codon:yes gene_type:complete